MKTQRIAFLIALYFVIAAGVVHASLVAEAGPVDLLRAFCTAIIVTLLCITDSKIIGRPMLHAARWIMFFTWPVAVPIYLVWSRGAKGLLVLVGHVGALVGMSVGIVVLMQEVLHIEPR